MNKENVIKHLESDYEKIIFSEVITNDHSYLSKGYQIKDEDTIMLLLIDDSEVEVKFKSISIILSSKKHPGYLND